MGELSEASAGVGCYTAAGVVYSSVLGTLQRVPDEVIAPRLHAPRVRVGIDALDLAPWASPRVWLEHLSLPDPMCP